MKTVLAVAVLVFVSQGGDSSQMSNGIKHGEVSAKFTIQTTHDGPVAIVSVHPGGNNIVLENISSGRSRTYVNLNGFKLQSNIDGIYIIEYNFKNFMLTAGKQVKIWAWGFSSQAGPNDLVNRGAESWGTGSNITTSLFNDKGEETAYYIQKINYN